MKRLAQTFRNSGSHPIYVSLEPIAARYRIEPASELILRYDDEIPQDEHNSTLRVEIVERQGGPEIIIWTCAASLFLPDGREAIEDHGV